MAFDGYVKIDGINGESTDGGHPQWVEIISFRHDVSQPAGTATSRVGGRTGARVNIADFTWTQVMDIATPNLHKFCCNGQHVGNVMCELCEAAGDKHMYFRWTFTNAIISSCKPSGVANEEVFARPVMEVSINFDTIQWEYVPLAHAGAAAAGLIGGWNMAENVAM